MALFRRENTTLNTFDGTCYTYVFSNGTTQKFYVGKDDKLISTLFTSDTEMIRSDREVHDNCVFNLDAPISIDIEDLQVTLLVDETQVTEDQALFKDNEDCTTISYMDLIRDEIQKLNDIDKEIVLLRLEGLTFPSIGDKFNMKPDAVRVKYNRITRKIKDNLCK